jgi:hypothetical protein
MACRGRTRVVAWGGERSVGTGKFLLERSDVRQTFYSISRRYNP